MIFILHHQVLYHRKTVVYYLVQLQLSRSYELRISYPSTVSYCFGLHIVFFNNKGHCVVASCQIVFVNRLVTSFDIYFKTFYAKKNCFKIGWLENLHDGII